MKLFSTLSMDYPSDETVTSLTDLIVQQIREMAEKSSEEEKRNMRRNLGLECKCDKKGA
ncbi:MAG: hypothetical protein ACFFEU_05160 [Candidatus Thorarchaeota archaeon]|jgi:hypothetical protein